MKFDRLLFSDHPRRDLKEEDKVVNVLELNENALFEYLARALDFPSYFGHNWDALYDCLSTLDWIEQPRVVLLYEVLPRLDRRGLTVYLSILNDVTHLSREAHREENHTHSEFLAIFPSSARERVETLSSPLS